MNKGFTLIEVLVAILILAVISIPVFRAMTTAFTTTSRSTMKMKATNVAENIMEDIKAKSIEEIIDKYGDETINYGEFNSDADGNIPPNDGNAIAYTFNLTDESNKYDDELNEALKKDYTAKLIINPNVYSNINGFNVAEYNIVSDENSAIYCMAKDLDLEAYKEFVDENIIYKSNNPEKHILDITEASESAKDPVKLLYTNSKYSEYREHFKREIRVDIKGDKDNPGEDIKVYVSVSYYFEDTSDQFLPKEKQLLKKISRTIFDNSNSGEELDSIFIMYNPLYNTKDGDIIVVHNPQNIECLLYIIAQNVDDYEDEFKNYKKEKSNSLILHIDDYETVHDDKKNDDIHPISLRANLIDEVEYTKDKNNASQGEDRQIPLKCNLNLYVGGSHPEGIDTDFSESYRKIIKNKGEFGEKNKKYSYKISAASLDGRTGDASSIKDKIYDVKVIVEKNNKDNEEIWPIKVELTGSIVEK